MLVASKPNRDAIPTESLLGDEVQARAKQPANTAVRNAAKPKPAPTSKVSKRTTPIRTQTRSAAPVVQPFVVPQERRVTQQAIAAALQKYDAPKPKPRVGTSSETPLTTSVEAWFVTPMIGTSHIAVLVVSGLMFGVALSTFALLAIQRLAHLHLVG